MAICFELVVNFGTNIEEARAAALTNPGPTTLQAGTYRIPLHRALLNSAGSCIELSVVPVAVGWGVGLDGTLSRTRLSAAELTELGRGLYDLLAKFDGLVLCEALRTELGLGDGYVEFQPGYLWVPYQGEKPSTLTAD